MSAESALTLSFPEPDIAVLTFDLPGKGANVLARAVLVEFESHLSTLVKRGGVAGLVIRSGKPGMFIAGADIREFVASFDVPKSEVIAFAEHGRKLFARLTELPFVSVAAIDGVCLGGGAEWALWCDRRLMGSNPKLQFGLPEVKLGLYPGWGGTVRLPRIVGLGNAVEMITSGESIAQREAVAMGLASTVVPSEMLDAAAIQLIRAEQQSRQYLADRQRWSQPIGMSETELMFLGATASAYIQQQTKGQYPAPVAALELLLETSQLDAATAGEREAASFIDLFASPINRSLINVFFLGDRNKKDPGIVADGVTPRPIRSVGVVGAGIMGAGIAAASVRRELSVTITDSAPGSLALGVQKILDEVSYNKATKGPDVKRMSQFAPLVRATTVDGEFASVDLVIEAVVENIDVKKALYARLEPQLRDDCLLASNTSAISITRLAEGLKHPERFVGIHFFNPVRQMPLVEVIRGARTSDETVATAVGYAKALGKSPIVVEDGPGFLVNRLLLPYMNEALELLAEGQTIEQVEKASKSFGMPMGPITLFDVVGLDTALFAGHVMHEAFPERIVESPMLAALVQAGRKGQKSGAGFFKYGSGKKDKQRGASDPDLLPLLQPYLRGGPKLSEKQIVDRLFLPMLCEATRILEERKVRDARDVDLGLIYGIGFPPFKGGLLFWADTIGAAKIVERLQPWLPLGPRFEPTSMLREMARTGKKFYD